MSPRRKDPQTNIARLQLRRVKAQISDTVAELNAVALRLQRPSDASDIAETKSSRA